MGYFLLTGTPPIRGDRLTEVLWKQVREVPEPPSARLGSEISGDLEVLILRCLSKRREDRPEHVRLLVAALQHCRSAGTWTVADAESWWWANGPREAEPTSTPAGGDVLAGAADATMTIDLTRRRDVSSTPTTTTAP